MMKTECVWRAIWGCNDEDYRYKWPLKSYDNLKYVFFSTGLAVLYIGDSSLHLPFLSLSDCWKCISKFMIWYANRASQMATSTRLDIGESMAERERSCGCLGQVTTCYRYLGRQVWLLFAELFDWCVRSGLGPLIIDDIVLIDDIANNTKFILFQSMKLFASHESISGGGIWDLPQCLTSTIVLLVH